MEEKLTNAVEQLAVKACETKSAIDAMHYTQAALNAVNALMTLKLRAER